jgi:4-amino-4-deoxy-L-arabinose transferase-like glycosyltransferase
MTPSLRSLPRPWLTLLIAFLALGAVLRLVNLTNPPLDFHPVRQLRNFIVARAIYYDWLPDADPQRRAAADSIRNVTAHYEPPIIESIVGVTYLLTGGENVAVPRIYGAIFWLLAGLCVFDLARRMTSSPAAGLVSLAYYLALPFAVQASRSFQPDPLMTASFVTGIYFLYRWTEDQTWKWAILAGAFAGFAVLVKIFIGFLMGGAAVAAVLHTLGIRFWRSRQVWVMAALMVVPAFLYYFVGSPGSSTEYIVNWSLDLLKLIATTKFYSSWLGFLGSLLGLAVLFLSLAGTLLAGARARALLIGLWTGYLLYGLLLPFQMYTHSYYHIQLVPVVALGLAPLAAMLAAQVSAQPRPWKAAWALLAAAVLGYQSWVARSVLVAEDFRNEPPFWAAIGAAIPPDTKVIALAQDYGYRLMYYGWRRVDLWPPETQLAQIRGHDRQAREAFAELTAGKDLFLVTAFGQLDRQPGLKEILDEYRIAAEGDGYVLYDLHAKR